MYKRQPLNLSADLEKYGVKILGTSPEVIDMAEDRDLFLSLIHIFGVEGEFVDFNYTEQYDDKDGEQKEETGTIAVTLTRLPKIQWEITALNDVVYAGDRIALSGNIMNVGQGKAYNVNVTMEVPGLHLEKTMFAGEVEKGTSAEIDGAVLVDGKPDKEKYGNTEAVSYTHLDNFCL